MIVADSPGQDDPTRAAIPSGLRWHLTARFTASSRRTRFAEIVRLRQLLSERTRLVPRLDCVARG